MTITEDFLKERPLSFSSLKEFIISPRHYLNYITKEREQTPDMLLGAVCHKLLLEAGSFDEEYAIEPKVDKRTTAGKEIAASFAIAAEGKTVVPYTTHIQAKDMVTEMLNSPFAKYFRMEGEPEKEFLFSHSSLPVRGFIDKELSEFNLEYKTVQSADTDDVIRDFYNRKYFFQAGIYNTYNNKPILYVVQEKSKPYMCKAFIVKSDDEYIKYGKAIFEKAIRDFRYCMDMDLFNAGYEFYDGSEPVSLSLPAWAKK